MAIDFYWLDDREGLCIASMSHELYDAIADVLGDLERKTSLFIDPYGDTRISPTHAGTFFQLLQQSKDLSTPDLQKLSSMLQASHADDRWLWGAGD